MTPIRPYRPVDHLACRDLWAELTLCQRELYDDPSIGRGDPGAAFEEYLTRLDLTGIWVADDPDDGVVGMVGLLLRGRAGEVEPVIVAESRRGKGIGRALLGHVREQAGKRGMTYLNVTPASRNEAAIRCLYGAGYQALSNVTLTLDVDPRSHQWKDGMDLYKLRFKY